ncbi:MAG: hypothetical protein HPY51_20190 [Candidatus Omnitrophica bacterium]|nr:hypothetical protein [Candidatus Omnitrophota bacterium]
MNDKKRIPKTADAWRESESLLADLERIGKMFSDPDPDTVPDEAAAMDPGARTEESSPVASHEKIVEALVKTVEVSGNVHETVRELVHETVKDFYEAKNPPPGEGTEPPALDGFELMRQRRNELNAIMENLDRELAGKSPEEVAAYFNSLLDLQGQLCLQKTEGVIAVRTRLIHFFPTVKSQPGVVDWLRQEITLIFSPEEISAMRAKFTSMPAGDPLKAFFTTVLDSAYDVVQYNELTGCLLLEMTQYFLKKLEEHGFGETPKTLEFKERHERSRIALKKAIGDLRDIERVVNQHLEERPVLKELPKYLRALIQIKLGLLDHSYLARTIRLIHRCLGDYARARSAVAFDFNRLPSFQHGVRLRQSIILNLQKDVLEYMGKQFEKEFRHVQREFDQMLEEIEAASEVLLPGSPEYEAVMRRKAVLQEKLEKHRRQLDIVKSQARLVDVQHQLITHSIKRFTKNVALHQKIEEELKARAKIDPEKTRPPAPPSEKTISRMVMAKRRS